MVAATNNAGPLVEMRGISKTFGPIKALVDVSLAVHAGEVHALMGENGAGKSTLIKILSGAYLADPGGEILVAGVAADIRGPADARSLGIAVIYQELSLAPNLTVAENVFLGRERVRGGRFSRRRLNDAVRPVLADLGVSFPPETKVGALSMGERQVVEIARAVCAEARVIVMDEPTTSLTTAETDRLFAIVGRLKARNIAIVYISHRMDEIYALSDRVSVLRDSRHVGTLSREEVSADRLVRMMVGRELSTFYTKTHDHRDDALLLEVEGLGDGRRVHDCDFRLHRGEVLGIAGLVGSGRTELARLVFGADRASAGRIRLDGRECRFASPREALDGGIAYLTEDRKGLGLFLDMTIGENVNLDVMSDDARAGVLDRRAALRRSQAAIARFAIRAPSYRASVGALSGGNQQKVLLARLMERRPRVLILDEPTRGVDIGAKSEIYRLIDRVAAEGMGVIVISSELAEIIGTCDRTLVMREGRIVGDLPRRDFTQERIIALTTVGADAAAA